MGVGRTDDRDRQTADLDRLLIVPQHHQFAGGPRVERNVQLTWRDPPRDFDGFPDAGDEIRLLERLAADLGKVGASKNRSHS